MAFAAPQSPVTPTDSAIPTATSGSASTEETVPILVRFKPGVLRSEVDAAIKATGGASMREHAQLGLRVVEVPAAAQEAVLTAYARHPLVRSAEPAHRVTAAGSPNDPLYAQQWALPKISWDKAYGVIPILGSAKIAVLDTGIDATQPDLIGRLSLGTSFVGGVATTDLNGHGTEVAGIAAANVNNLVGMAGVAFSGASVVPVQVLHTDGTGWDSDVVSGVLWAADNGAQVILMSFSSTAFSSALQDAVNYAWSKGAIVIAAAGNQGSTAASYPAGMANVIGVAATDANDAVTAISNTGSAAVAAPGVDIYATAPAASYVKISGTSPAAAETAGLAALLIASGKSNSAASAQIRGATDPIAGRSFGRINVAKALGAPVTPPPTPAPTATPPPGPTPTYTIGAVNFMRLRQVNATGQENYIYTSGDVIYPDANVTPAGTHYKVVVTDAAGTPHGSFSCGTAPFTGASNTYTVQSTDPVSNASDWTFTINQYSATDTTCTGTITNTDHLAFDVAKATAYTDSSLSTTATQYSSGDTAYVVIQGVQQSQSDYSTIWIPTGFTDLTATCHNTTGSDQPDTSSVGRLPSPAGSFLQYPPGASGDPWNLLANYDSTGQACPLTTPGQWQIKVQKNSTHFVTLNAFTVVAAARGTLVVTKNTVGGNGVFTFTTSDGPGGPPATFSITTTGPLTAGVGSATFAVNAGTYTITEQVPADFVLSGAGCPAPIGMSPTVTVAVASGGTSGDGRDADAHGHEEHSGRQRHLHVQHEWRHRERAARDVHHQHDRERHDRRGRHDVHGGPGHVRDHGDRPVELRAAERELLARYERHQRHGHRRHSNGNHERLLRLQRCGQWFGRRDKERAGRRWQLHVHTDWWATERNDVRDDQHDSGDRHDDVQRPGRRLVRRVRDRSQQLLRGWPDDLPRCCERRLAAHLFIHGQEARSDPDHQEHVRRGWNVHLHAHRRA